MVCKQLLWDCISLCWKQDLRVKGFVHTIIGLWEIKDISQWKRNGGEVRHSQFRCENHSRADCLQWWMERGTEHFHLPGRRMEWAFSTWAMSTGPSLISGSPTIVLLLKVGDEAPVSSQGNGAASEAAWRFWNVVFFEWKLLQIWIKTALNKEICLCVCGINIFFQIKNCQIYFILKKFALVVFFTA